MRTYLTSLLLMVTLLLPGAASAGWGNENWGEMIWGRWIPLVPSMSIENLLIQWHPGHLEGWIALAISLVVVPTTLLARRHRRGAP